MTAGDTDDHTDEITEHAKKTVAIFVPLVEEFRILQEVFDLKYSARGTMLRWKAQCPHCELFVYAPSEMGNLPAYEATVDFLRVHSASLVIAIGIGGAARWRLATRRRSRRHECRGRDWRVENSRPKRGVWRIRVKSYAASRACQQAVCESTHPIFCN